MLESTMFQPWPCVGGESVENQCMNGTVQEFARSQPQIQPEGVVGQPHMANLQLICILHQDREDHGMQMQMEVSIDVVQWQAEGAKLSELLMDFGTQLGS